MRTRITPQFRTLAAQLSFKFACEDCGHFDSARKTCAHGYPPGPMRVSLGDDALDFCKEFELGGPDTEPDEAPHPPSKNEAEA